MKKINNVSCETILKKTFILLFVCFALFPFGVKAQGIYLDDASAYAIIDKNSGMIYASDHLDDQLGIASLTKLMSIYVFADYIVENNVTLDTMIPITDNAVEMSMNGELSGVYFNYNEEFSLDTLLNLMLIYSDNGATVSIAEYLFGSEESAVEQMNLKAEELNLTQSFFYNTTGLTMVDYGEYMLEGTSESDYNVSSARDMMNLTRSLLIEYPQIVDYVSHETVEFRGYTLPSYNLMLPGLTFEYEGVVGMKTGTSDEAGACFVGYYIDPETQREYLSIVLGAQDKSHRFTESAEMYDYVSTMTYNEITNEDISITENILGSKNKEYKLALSDEYYFPSSTPLNLTKVGVTYNEKYFDDSNELISDIPEGETVMTYNYSYIGDEEQEVEFITGSSDEFQINLITEDGIEKENIFQGIARAFTDLMEGLYKG